MKVSDNTSISMPMRNLISILAAVGIGIWAFFGVIERLNNLETKATLAEKDLTSEVQRIDKDIESLVTGDIAQNNELSITLRSSAVELLSKKDAPELVDFLIEMLGNPNERDKVNKFSLSIMGDLSEEKMLLALS